MTYQGYDTLQLLYSSTQHIPQQQQHLVDLTPATEGPTKEVGADSEKASTMGLEIANAIIAAAVALLRAGAAAGA